MNVRVSTNDIDCFDKSMFVCVANDGINAANRFLFRVTTLTLFVFVLFKIKCN